MLRYSGAGRGDSHKNTGAEAYVIRFVSIGERQRASKYALVVMRHQAPGDQHQNRRRQQASRKQLKLLPVLPENRERSRTADQQSFIRTAIRQDDGSDRQQHSISNVRAAFHARQSAQHQRSSRRRDRAAIISIDPVAKQPQPQHRQHSAQ